jgi:hypothetical protein
MLENLRHILDDDACDSIQKRIDENVILLFRLGESHFNFARNTSSRYWRQRISRFYYGAYNVRRALQLNYSGIYRTDTSDHKEVGNFPNGFPNVNTYSRRLVDLRDDRNIADYDHSAEEEDLVLTQSEAENLVSSLIKDAKTFLTEREISL